jgi:uncharacterized protein YndB with AHSA1/START domain
MQKNPKDELAAIVKEIDISAPRELVFELFITKFGDWWPLARFSRTRGSPPQRVVLEARVGGPIYEVSADGSELAWGSVTEIDPERRIVMAWHLGRPISTVVEVTFESLDGDQTRVRLEHRGWEKLEAAGATVERQGYDGGWNLILNDAFTSFVSKNNQILNSRSL